MKWACASLLCLLFTFDSVKGQEPPVAVVNTHVQVSYDPPVAMVSYTSIESTKPTGIPLVPPVKVVTPPGRTIRTVDGWLVREQANGVFVRVEEQPVTSGVVTSPRPFQVDSTTRGIVAQTPPVGTNLRKTNGVEPKTTEPFGFKAETQTERTITAVPNVGRLGNTSWDMTNGKQIVGGKTDEQGNKWIYYADGSTRVCSSSG